jgi:hypothetical protein
MYIETTININPYVLGMISRAVLITGQPRNQIISNLLGRLAYDHVKMVATWSRVRYQNRNTGGKWSHLHLSLRPDEYEYFLDLRKIFKFSVSFLVSYAVEKYLDEILDNLCKGDDNYRYKNYMLTRVIVDGVISWILSWGIPRTIITNHY